MLSTLSDKNDVYSWSIFQEKSGFVSLKTKFESHTKSITLDRGAHFKQKAHSQLKHDAKGSDAWMTGRGRETLTLQPDVSPSGDSKSVVKKNAL